MASRALAILFVTLSLGLAVTWLIHYLNKPTSHQPKAEAVEQYNMGLTAWLAGDLHSAAFALDKAVTLDDQFPLAHARLAQVWSELDYPEKGEHELSRLTSLVPNQSVLPEVDALYLDAIKASVANDFSRAANRYEAITRLSPREEIAFASLGYAYEMNGELAKSAAAYLEATARDPGSPALMLRLGIVYGKQKDLGKASTAFDRADQLYKASRHSKGQIEVLIQRGVLAQKLQQTQEASRYYKQIFQTIRSTDGFEAHEFQTIRTLFHVASRLYPTNKDKGQEYERGAIDWAQDMDRSGLLNHGADELLLQGLVDLGNQFLVNEDLDEARSRFNRAKRIAERSGLIRGMARVRFALGQLSLRDGATLQADSYFKEVLETEFQIRNLSYDSIEQWRKEILGVDYETAVLIFRKRFVESH